MISSFDFQSSNKNKLENVIESFCDNKQKLESYKNKVDAALGRYENLLNNIEHLNTISLAHLNEINKYKLEHANAVESLKQLEQEIKDGEEKIKSSFEPIGGRRVKYTKNSTIRGMSYPEATYIVWIENGEVKFEVGKPNQY